jgi:glycosyltransferase involved in cell wall biosynthesis
MCLANIFSIVLSTFTVSSLSKTEKADEKFRLEIKELGSRFFADAAAQQYPFISVLIPARNEERLIEMGVRSILDQSSPSPASVQRSSCNLYYPSERFEVIVVDDGSTDATPKILERLQAEYGSNRLKIVSNPVMTPEVETQGWLGKSYALHIAYQMIDPRAELLLFMDADASLKPGALRYSVSYTLTNSLGLFSLVLNQNNHKDFWFRLLRAEVIRFFYLSQIISTELFMLRFNITLQNKKIGNCKQRAYTQEYERKQKRERYVIQANAIGSFLLFSRQVYEEIGGHYAVHRYMRDDVQFAKLVARGGYQVELKPGYEFGNLIPNQDGLPSLWSSNVKTIFMATDKNWLVALTVIWVELLYHVVIPTYAVTKLFGQLWKKTNRSNDYSWSHERKIIKGANRVSIFSSIITLLLYILAILKTNKLLGISPVFALFQPFSVVLTCVMMIYSGIRTRKGLKWKGRRIIFKLDG